MSSLTASSGLPLPVVPARKFSAVKYSMVVLGVVFTPSVLAAVLLMVRAN